MADTIETFGFENEDIKGSLYEKYKGKKGETHRGGIIYTDPKAMFVGSKVHYKDKFFLCKKGKCCESLGPSKWRVGAVLVKYSTDKQGNPKKPFGFDLLPWVFGEQTYVKLKNVNSEFPLANHDIKISCENEDYQTLSITPCNESIWTREEIKASILDQAKPIWEYLKRAIASDLSVEEINDLLGIPSAASADPSSKLNLDDVLDKI